MKFFLIALFFLIPFLSLAQLTISKNVIKNYNAVVKKLPSNYQKVIKQQSGLIKSSDNLSGFAIATIYHIDTLNKKSVPDHGAIHIYSIDTNRKTGKVIFHEQFSNLKNENVYQPVLCTVLLIGDTLSIITPPPFSPFVVHKVLGGKIKSTYEEDQKRDTIFSLNLTKLKTERLSIPVKTLIFKLNTIHFKAGQVLYGEIEFITADYYVDDSAFKSSYIHKRLRCKYVFRAYPESSNLQSMIAYLKL